MIHIFTAIECEASPLRHLVNDDISLTVTGVGKVNAAFAVGRTFGPDKTRNDLLNDVVINVGICGSGNLEGMYLVNKITDNASQRDFYPDILRVFDIDEAPLITADDTVTDPADGVLYDMEGSGLFEAANKLISPDRIIILKIVSDKGDTERLTPAIISSLISKYVPDIERVISEVRSGLIAKPDESYDDLYELLHASASMTVQIDELMAFASSLGVDGRALFMEQIEASEDAKINKAKGKEIINRVRSILIS
ncbi:MAG: hypothetical protein J6127_08760 [Clostridiales bacterium]|nr:hypothetical protein [Clostridiales bacterium]